MGYDIPEVVAVPRFDPESIAARRQQWERYARWEEQQQAAKGPGDSRSIQRALDWYSDALEFAQRQGAAGPGAPETHLEDLIAWVRRWRVAWRAA